MKATCPKDPSHDRFITVAAVQEYWLVDSCGEFVDVSHSGETLVRPDPLNTWECAECGSEADVVG